MKALSRTEVQDIAEYLGQLQGARMQQLCLRGSCFYFEFYSMGEKSYWVLDLQAKSPVFLPLTKVPAGMKKSETKPLSLFIKKHFLGSSLVSVVCPAELGRGLHLIFSNGGLWEFRLFPHGSNFILRKEDKQISWKPVKDLKVVIEGTEESTPRSLEELVAAYEVVPKKKTKTALAPEALKEKKLQKIKKAIQKIQSSMSESQLDQWKQVGNLLVQKQSLNIGEEWAGFVDLELSLANNIELAFANYKKLEKKMAGHQKRLDELEKELSGIESGEIEVEVPSKQVPIVKSKTAGRHMTLPSGDLLFIGKKASENLKVLREAKPWDLWFHLRDFPGAHAVLRKAKNKAVSRSVLHAAAEKLLVENFRSKRTKHQGESFDVMIAEVRHVRPIKGDKLGRVTCRKETVIRVRHP